MYCCPLMGCTCTQQCAFWNKEYSYCHLARAVTEIPKQLEEIEKQLRKLNKK